MALYLYVGPEDRVHVGEDTVITLVKKSGKRALLRFDGPADVDLERAPAATVEDGDAQPPR